MVSASLPPSRIPRLSCQGLQHPVPGRTTQHLGRKRTPGGPSSVHPESIDRDDDGEEDDNSRRDTDDDGDDEVATDEEEDDEEEEEEEGRKAPFLLDLAVSMLVGGVKVFLVVSISMHLAIFLHFAFFSSYLPESEHAFPVPFQFRPCPDGGGGRRCSDLSALVNFVNKHGGERPLALGQDYVVILKLILPESEVNREHGMFLSCVRFLSASGAGVPARPGAARSAANNHAAFSAERGLCAAASLAHRSRLTAWLWALARAPMLVTRASVEEQEVDVILDEEFQDDYENPVVGVEVQVLSRVLQVRHAELHLISDFKGLKRLMFEHPFLVGVAGVSINFVFIFVFLSCGLCLNTLCQTSNY